MPINTRISRAVDKPPFRVLFPTTKSPNIIDIVFLLSILRPTYYFTGCLLSRHRFRILRMCAIALSVELKDQ